MIICIQFTFNAYSFGLSKSSTHNKQESGFRLCGAQYLRHDCADCSQRRGVQQDSEGHSPFQQLAQTQASFQDGRELDLRRSEDTLGLVLDLSGRMELCGALLPLHHDVVEDHSLRFAPLGYSLPQVACILLPSHQFLLLF